MTYQEHIESLAAALDIAVSYERAEPLDGAYRTRPGAKPTLLLSPWADDGRDGARYLIALHEVGHHVVGDTYVERPWNDLNSMLYGNPPWIVAEEAAANAWALDNVAVPVPDDSWGVIGLSIGSYLDQGLPEKPEHRDIVASVLSRIPEWSPEQVLTFGYSRNPDAEHLFRMAWEAEQDARVELGLAV